MPVDNRVAGYLGRVLDPSGWPAATCFQVAPRVVVTAWHVVDELGAGAVGAVVGVDPLRGGDHTDARVSAVDPFHDLAVLRLTDPLPGCVVGMAATDDMVLTAAVSVTGVPRVDDDYSYRHVDAPGIWGGGAMRGDQLPLGRMISSSVLKGMSGAPVTDAGGLVVGVVSGRYNSADGWLRDSVWVARTENLAGLLRGLAEFSMTTRARTGPVEVTLSVDATEVRLSGPVGEVSAAHGGVPARLVEAMRGLRRTRSGSSWGQRGTDVGLGVAATAIEVGVLMAAVFLPDPIAEALAELIADAQARHAPIRLGIDAAGQLSGLPWEALALPDGGGPVALHPLIVAYRRHPRARPVTATRGPLRVLVAISSPTSGDGGVLDYERELRNVLLAVRGARQGDAEVRIVHFATTAEIHAALLEQPVHVLHLSGHGKPGLLELEDQDGNPRPVNATTLVAEAIPPGAMPPVIVLAACHTDAVTATGDPSFAAELITRGVSVVIGTETSVTDVYATAMFSRIYESLVATDTPDVIDALATARRTIQRQLLEATDTRGRALAELEEWAVVSVLAATGSVVLLDPAGPPQRAAGQSGSAVRETVPAGLLAREIGEFVGRRRAQRRWPTELLAPGAAGLVLHGIGGVGKTTLASELIRRITDRDPPRITVVAASGLRTGHTSVDEILTKLGRVLRFRLRDLGTADMRAAAELALRPDEDWRYRLTVLRDYVLASIPVLLVLDNFEDNLTAEHTPDQPGWRGVSDPALAELLGVLATTPGRCRLLITSRYPFTLPGDAHRGLGMQHLGALSVAETMKLAWALPALDRLDEADLAQVCRLLGGHPRSLEYLDALLSGGKGAYPDVTARLSTALRARLGVEDLTDWFSHHHDLDPALGEVITLAADDVLLPQLLAGLKDTPGAVELLVGASVYRRPVDDAALLFQIGEPDPTAGHTPDRRAAEQRIRDILDAAGVAVEDTVDSEGSLDISVLAPALRRQLEPHVEELVRRPTPPRRVPTNLPRLIGVCAASSLLSRDTDTPRPLVFVHRWSATELHRRWAAAGRADQLATAHHRAADYWRWRVQVWPQDRARDLEDNLEARYHLLEAHQPDQAATITEHICGELHSWGAWDREETLIHDTLTRLPAASDRRSAWIQQLGNIARDRGRPGQAAELYQQAFALNKALIQSDPANTGYQRDLSVSYDTLGGLARAVGDIPEATRLYHQALTIAERLVERDPANTGYQRDLSVSYNTLGGLARAVGDIPEATRLYHQALTIAERLVERDPANTDYQRDLSVSYNTLGGLARAVGDIPEATRLYHQALTIAERLVERDPANTGYQRDLSISYERLGGLAEAVGDIPEATRLYHQALTIAERLVERDPANTGYQRDLSVSYNTLGGLAQAVGDIPEARVRLSAAIDIQTRVHKREPQRVDLAEELGVALCQYIDITGEVEPSRSTALAALQPLERQQLLTPQGTAVLTWLHKLDQ
jgi:tetratricopeptide (TPR) repeat protein